MGNTTTFIGQKLLDGKPITYNSTTNPQNEIQFTPPKVSSASLGNDSGKLSDLSSLLSQGKYDDAMKIAKDAQSTILGGRAAGGNFAKTVQIQKDMVLDQMGNTTALYNQASAAVYSQPNRAGTAFTSAILNMNRLNTRTQILGALLGGIK